MQEKSESFQTIREDIELLYRAAIQSSHFDNDRTVYLAHDIQSAQMRLLTLLESLEGNDSMIVCDICKSSKCFEIRIPVIKVETGSATKRPKDKIVIEPRIDLCDSCLTKFMSNLGYFLKNQRGDDVSEGKEEGASTLEESAIDEAKG